MFREKFSELQRALQTVKDERGTPEATRIATELTGLAAKIEQQLVDDADHRLLLGKVYLLLANARMLQSRQGIAAEKAAKTAAQHFTQVSSIYAKRLLLMARYTEACALYYQGDGFPHRSQPCTELHEAAAKVFVDFATAAARYQTLKFWRAIALSYAAQVISLDDRLEARKLAQKAEGIFGSTDDNRAGIRRQVDRSVLDSKEVAQPIFFVEHLYLF
ncbi:MAG TPA: hypothetical protein VLA88_01975 [Candidatus Saccharimonadales bacterium]|nr:hypothetical protein [Candidatus Saccharimonadales bacterium]